MPSGTLDTITKLINSPPGQLLAGGALAGTVWNFFERVEAVLTENTKLEIAVWLFGVKIGQKMEPWPETFATVFDRVFGAKHLSWRCFGRSAVASIILGSFGLARFVSMNTRGSNLGTRRGSLAFGLVLFIFNVIPDYVSLLETRWLLRLMRRSGAMMTIALLFIDLLFTGATAIGWGLFLIDALSVTKPPPVTLGLSFLVQYGRMWLVYPAFFTSIWLWLYACSGLLLKAARRFDIGFDWFNRKFDIEKKPLHSIGLVSGALVAIVYWSVVIVTRLVR